jgi:hypothetical protein
MKSKLLTGLAGLLLASSTTFASWGVSVGIRAPHPYYAPRAGVYVAPAPVYAPYVAPAPYVSTYVEPAPFAGAVWCPGHWVHGPRGRYWVRGYWEHR